MPSAGSEAPAVDGNPKRSWMRSAMVLAAALIGWLASFRVARSQAATSSGFRSGGNTG